MFDEIIKDLLGGGGMTKKDKRRLEKAAKQLGKDFKQARRVFALAGLPEEEFGWSFHHGLCVWKRSFHEMAQVAFDHGEITTA
jgi:hypothetical protein